MRDIDVKEVTRAVAECCIDSCNNLPVGVLKKLEAARKEEISPLGCQVLDTIIENAKLANKKQVPLCQDTGLTVVYREIRYILLLYQKAAAARTCPSCAC